MPYPQEFITAYETQELSQAFIMDHISASPVAASMDFASDNVEATVAGLRVTVVRDKLNSASAAARPWNQNYPIVNSIPDVDYFDIKTFGGAFNVDLELDAALGGSISKRELNSKEAHAVREFQRQLFYGQSGGGTVNPAEFVGMNAYCMLNAGLADGGMVINETLTAAGAMSEAQAFAILEYFEEVTGDMEDDANRIWASRLMAAKLRTAASILKRNTDSVTIAGKTYQTFLDIPLIGVDNSVGMKKVAPISGEEIEEVFVGRVGSTLQGGLYCATPKGLAKFVSVNKAVPTGQPLAEGYVDWKTCFVPVSKKSLRKAQIITKLGA
jgi:hypothetical protein